MPMPKLAKQHRRKPAHSHVLSLTKSVVVFFLLSFVELWLCLIFRENQRVSFGFRSTPCQQQQPLRRKEILPPPVATPVISTLLLARPRVMMAKPNNTRSSSL